MAGKSAPDRRQRRPDGELSRTRILDAAAEIAAERGYEGTSIGAVSTKCGLPASSIYWHFKDKDDLIAAVIERSFTNWLTAWQLPDAGSAEQRGQCATPLHALPPVLPPGFTRIVPTMPA